MVCDILDIGRLEKGDQSSFLDEDSKIVNSKSCADAMFLDFEKSFDKVPHRRLIKKLKEHGINGLVVTGLNHDSKIGSNEPA
jgi:isochorismate hydrolase